MTRTLARLNKRADFLRAQNSGLRVAQSNFLLFGFKRDDTGEPARIGFTISKKVGIAVVRNKIRRRFKELVRLHNALFAPLDMDYVILPRSSAEHTSFEKLSLELVSALSTLHKRISKDVSGL